jgi:hypothetical protein
VAATERKPGSGEIVQTGMLLVRDEEGKLRGRATNQEATEILCDCCGEIGGYVVGKALWVADDLLAKETE